MGLGIVAVVAAHLIMLQWMRAPEPMGAMDAPPEHKALAADPQTKKPAAAQEPPTVVAELTEQQNSTPKPQAPKEQSIADLVLLISVDGLRPDALNHAKHIRRLSFTGAHASNARTISKSSTLPSHASMVSGVDFRRHGLSFNSYRPERGHIQYPTIFSAAQKAGLSTALFVGKRKLEHLLDPEGVGHFEVGGVYCNKVTALAAPYLEQAGPGIVFVHFSDPDGAGHRDGWMSREYNEAVARADRCVKTVLEALARRQSDNRTLVLLTSDHGGHDHNHGSRRKLDRHIPWVLWGAGVKPKGRIHTPVYNTDTAATILHALGLPLPGDIEGRPITEAFES